MITRAGKAALRHRILLRRVVPLTGPVLLRLPEFALYVRLDDWVIGARIALRRAYEPHVARVVRTLLRPGMRVIDLGANIGYYTLLAATRVGPTGHVTAFEPSLENAALLARSVAANGLRNVTLVPCAAAEATRTVELLLDDSNGRLVEVGVAGARRVQAVALDRLFGPDEPVDLLKIDIEGAEDLALAGMARLLAARRPIIVSELSPPGLRAVSRVSAEAYMGRLRDHGYELYVIDRRTGVGQRPENDVEVLAHLEQTASEHLDILALPERRRRILNTQEGRDL